MMAVSAAIGALSRVAGLYLSYYRGVSSGASIVLVATAIFVVVFLFAPSTGAITTRVARRLHFGHTERDQFAEKRALAMNGVEGFSLLAGHPDALLRNDTQTRLFDHRVDGPRQVAGGRIGLNDREGALDRHQIILWDCKSSSDRAAYSRSLTRGASARCTMSRLNEAACAYLV